MVGLSCFTLNSNVWKLFHFMFTLIVRLRVAKTEQRGKSFYLCWLWVCLSNKEPLHYVEPALLLSHWETNKSHWSKKVLIDSATVLVRFLVVHICISLEKEVKIPITMASFSALSLLCFCLAIVGFGFGFGFVRVFVAEIVGGFLSPSSHRYRVEADL